MVVSKEINDLVNQYCRLRDRQYAVYHKCAKQNGLSTNELFVLDILWFAKNGITQKEICERMSANKQTIASIVNKFNNKGYVEFIEVKEDRRNKPIKLTESGLKYVKQVIPPAADAENLAMVNLGIENIKQLVKLTTALAENMEDEFNKISNKKENKNGIL